MTSKGTFTHFDANKHVDGSLVMEDDSDSAGVIAGYNKGSCDFARVKLRGMTKLACNTQNGHSVLNSKKNHIGHKIRLRIF
jgi:hypothetical protein